MSPAKDAPEPSSFRLAITLGIAGLLSGLVLVGVYEVTAPRIAENEAEALRQAIFAVVPDSTTMKPVVEVGGELQAVDKERPESRVFAAYGDSGKLQGYAIVAEGAGFQDVIRLIYGYDPERQVVTGMEVLASRETPGLGDKIYKDQDFVSAFEGLAVKPKIKIVKDGADAPNEVDVITGATISSQAVVDIINSGNERWLKRLPEELSPPVAQKEHGR